MAKGLAVADDAVVVSICRNLPTGKNGSRRRRHAPDSRFQIPDCTSNQAANDGSRALSSLGVGVAWGALGA